MPIVRIDTTEPDPFIPDILRRDWASISEAGHDVLVERMGMGRLRSRVTTDRVNVEIQYTNTHRQWTWNDSSIHVDGHRRPLASGPAQLLAILADPDTWTSDHDTRRDQTYVSHEMAINALDRPRPREELVTGTPVDPESPGIPKTVRNSYRRHHTPEEAAKAEAEGGLPLIRKHDGTIKVRDKFMWRDGVRWAVSGTIETPGGEVLVTSFYGFSGGEWKHQMLVYRQGDQWFETEMPLDDILRILLGEGEAPAADTHSGQAWASTKRRHNEAGGKNDRLTAQKKTVFRV